MQFSNERRFHVYSLYYGVKPQEDKLGLAFNTEAESIQEEIISIKYYF